MELPKLEINDKDEGLCYGCGKDNPIGLKLQFVNDEGVARAQFIPGLFHQGWSDVTHGGILYALLDEAGGYALLYGGMNYCVTAKSEVRFNSPARINEPMQISARITRKTSRLVETEAILSRQDGSIIATNFSIWYMAKRPNSQD